VLTGIASALSAALLVLLLAVTVQQRGLLGGTLLGEFILVRIERFHYTIVAIGFVLAALSTINGLLGSIFERRREIGVLKAVGWRTGDVAWLFVIEGLLLGLLGGAVGALLGSAVFLGLYRMLSPAFASVIVLGVAVPGLVGALAALYPAWVAARVLPAEAVRYE
ncbi:MAG: FtsX-like permease family protein, partial [Chloroflexi bacterium]|nr:FtsX-like permease family protein [Chloroflexota bacterium]